MADKIHIPKDNLVDVFSKLQKGTYVSYRHGSFCDGAPFERIFEDAELGMTLELHGASGYRHFIPLRSLDSVEICQDDAK